MPKMIVSIDGVVIKEVQLTKDRTTLGRRPYNDIVIDNLAVSGEHAVMQMSGAEVFLEDLNSTNGTYVNGKAIKKQQFCKTATRSRSASTRSSSCTMVRPTISRRPRSSTPALSWAARRLRAWATQRSR